MFWDSVDIGRIDECWKWKKATFKKGYGAVNYKGHVIGAHRLAFFTAFKKWPKVCRHTCDNPICCNPFHLLDGSYRENSQDMIKRGRCRSTGLPGERNSFAKLNQYAVDQIRSKHASGEKTSRELAIEFKVSKSTIYAVLSGQNWKKST